MSDFDEELQAYDVVIAKLQSLWREAKAKLDEAYSIAETQGFMDDLHDIHYARQHIGDTFGFQATERDLQLRLWRLVQRLDGDARSHGRVRVQGEEAWILCPRSHAIEHAMWQLPGFLTPPPEAGRLLLKMMDRFHPGADLVYAIAPAQ